MVKRVLYNIYIIFLWFHVNGPEVIQGIGINSLSKHVFDRRISQDIFL